MAFLLYSIDATGKWHPERPIVLSRVCSELGLPARNYSVIDLKPNEIDIALQSRKDLGRYDPNLDVNRASPNRVVC